jgi:hypothetical protein
MEISLERKRIFMGYRVLVCFYFVGVTMSVFLGENSENVIWGDFVEMYGKEVEKGVLF